jgi:hypothetical protein
MFVPSNAISRGEVPTAKVPSVAPAGDSSVTVSLRVSVTHMFAPSNAIPHGPVPAAKVPRGPHVGAAGVQAARVFLQATALREATGARGARQSSTAGGQTLQGPIAQPPLHVPPELPELDALEELDALLDELEELDEVEELDVLDEVEELDVLDEVEELDVLGEPPAVPPAPVVPPVLRTPLLPQAATATSVRTRETGTGRAGMIAA